MENAKKINNPIKIENERKVNNAIALIMICFSIVQVIFIVLFYFYPTIFPYFDNGYVLFGFAISLLIPGIIQWVYPKHLAWMKYVLLPVMLLMVSYLDYVFTIGTFALFVLPTILSGTYHSKKYCFAIFGLSILSLTINSVIIYIASLNGLYKSIFPFDFSDPITTFINFYLVQVILYIIIAVTSLAIMEHSKYSIDKQVRYSSNLISIKSEIDTASKIQLSILPTNFNLAVDQGYHISALMKPAKEVAGDFYDFFYNLNHLFLVVGDVSDKGLSAAMFMMNVKNTIRALSRKETDISKILTEANKIISENNKELMFVTIWMAAIELDTGKGEFISAGHCPAFIKSTGNKISKLESEPQTIIGVDENISYVSTKFVLSKGSNLFIYTDGVTDAMNSDNSLFGEEGIINSLSQEGYEPNEIINNVSNSINDYVGDTDQFDDITILSLYNAGFDKEERFDYDLNNVRKVVDTANEYLKNANANIDVIDNVDSAIDDVVSNIVDYTKNTKKDYFAVKYSVFAGNFIISFIDYGEPFNPLESAKPDLSDDRKIGGLGIYLFRNIMDESYYKRIGDKNILTLIKKIN